ncbi:LrgA-associated membrane protein LrgB [Minicystis rosea]|nr:LrgA-associated membrane protein LrgB [Minicystis rosea]
MSALRSLGVSIVWIGLTLAAFAVGKRIEARFRGFPLANSVLVAVAILAALLRVTGTRYDTYFAGARPIHLLLGPATVALAVPLAEQLPRLRRSASAMATALLAGALTAMASAAGIASVLGASRMVVLSLLPKSATTPIAMGISARLGGVPTLSAAFALITGLIGAVLLVPLMRLAGVTDRRAQGLAAGTAAHGLGAARAAALDDTAGAFAALAIGANGIVTSLLAPLFLRLFAI